MSKHKHKKHKLPHGCEKKTLTLGGRTRTYARKGDLQFWRESQSRPGHWHEEDEFTECKILRNEWDSDDVEEEPDTKTKKKRKAVELEETGQGRNGRLWLYDDPKRDGQKFYCVLELVNHRKSGCVTFEVITTRGRASHLFGRKEMTLLLKKISKVYAGRYGKKEFLRAISPNIGEKS